MTEITQPAPIVQFRAKDPQFREIYSNATLTSLSPFDISVLFQKNTEISPGQYGPIDMIAVTFSPQHFKSVVRSLIETLAAYELSFGELNIPDEDTKPLKDRTELAALVQSAKERARAASTP